MSSWKQATNTPAKIAQWKSQWPGCNWAAITGIATGFVVIDLDTPEAIRVAEELGLPDTPSVATARGRHVYLRAPAMALSSRVELLPGMDLRADGGFVVLPPSVHATGIRYEWIDGQHPNDVPLAPCPQWVIDLCGSVDAAPPPSRVTEGKAFVPTGLREGTRNVTLNRISGSLRGFGATQAQVRWALQDVNKHVAPPLSQREVHAITTSYAAEAPDVSKSIGALATMLEIWQPRLGLSDVEASCLIDGFLFAGRAEGSLTVSMPIRQLARRCKIPKSTAKRGVESLVARGCIEEASTHKTKGATYTVSASTLAGMLRPLARNRHEPELTVLGVRFPLSLFCPIGPDNPINIYGLLYVPYAHLLRYCCELNIDRSTFKYFLAGSDTVSRSDLASALTLTADQAKRRIARMKKLGLVKEERGRLNLDPDIEAAVGRALRATGAIDRIQRREAKYQQEVQQFRSARSQHAPDGPEEALLWLPDIGGMVDLNDAILVSTAAPVAVGEGPLTQC